MRTRDGDVPARTVSTLSRVCPFVKTAFQ